MLRHAESDGYVAICGNGAAYEWILTPPGDRLVVHMITVANGQSGAKPFFDATLQLVAYQAGIAAARMEDLAG